VNIVAYETNLGLFVRQDTEITSYSSNYTYNVKINGNDVVLHSKQWTHLENVFSIDSYQEFKKDGNKHVGYELKISSVASDAIPLNISVEEVNAKYDDDQEEWIWEKYNDLKGLYKPVHVALPDEWKDVEYSVRVIRKLQIDNYEKPLEMKVQAIVEGSWNSQRKEVDLSQAVSYSDIERLLTPDFLLHERPCTLSSLQMYQIVRAHIKDNIDGKYARITSDYDFAFTVKRRIAIKPYTVRTEEKNSRGRSFARPKFKTTSVEHREVELFEMTHTERNYQGYTPISSYSANSLKEMSEFLKDYLDNLMAEINRPVQECSHCGGTGHVEMKKIGTNERGC